MAFDLAAGGARLPVRLRLRNVDTIKLFKSVSHDAMRKWMTVTRTAGNELRVRCWWLVAGVWLWPLIDANAATDTDVDLPSEPTEAVLEVVGRSKLRIPGL